jgi:purine-cytosine permease-like protein
MPFSWLPLAADYTRFARSRNVAFAGTGVGYGIAQAWFYLLGVLLILSKVAPNLNDAGAFVVAVLAVPLGVIVMTALAVGEVDKPFANTYSAAVSVQNAAPRLGQRKLAIIIGAACTGLAVLLPLAQYYNFLLLIGAVFVPLFGVQAAHYAIVRRGYTIDELYGDVPGVRIWGAVAWLAGFTAYNWLNPGSVYWWKAAMGWLFGTTSTPWLSASITSFVVAFAIEAALVLRPGARRATPASVR